MGNQSSVLASVKLSVLCGAPLFGIPLAASAFAAQFFLQIFCDLLAMEPSIFDEDFIGS
jgi:hypothetical protein